MATAATDDRRSTEDSLKAFVRAILGALDVAPEDAAITADVLVAADLRGIESHGVARLASSDIRRLRAGQIAARPAVETVRETPTSIVVDAGNGLGYPVAKRTMDAVIAKALAHGAAFGAVRNSNHFGIAGAYAMQALDHNLIGIATTNAVRVAAPTYGSQIMLGSNPFAYAVPAGDEPPFVLDFATTTNPRETLDGALLPLGGLGVEGGGHKGYGLGLLADILSGVFSGGRFGRDLPLPGDAPLPGAISHWFAAFRVDGFRDIDEFKRDMDIELRNFKDSAKAPGQDRIYVAGEIEHEMTLEHRKHGVPIRAGVWDGLAALGAELGVPLELALVPAGDSL